jgi:hypothetical protein
MTMNKETVTNLQAANFEKSGRQALLAIDQIKSRPIGICYIQIESRLQRRRMEERDSPNCSKIAERRRSTSSGVLCSVRPSHLRAIDLAMAYGEWRAGSSLSASQTVQLSRRPELIVS